MNSQRTRISEERTLLRVYLSESDKLHGKPVHEAIISAAREAGVAGATVLRGILGFGADRRMHSAKLLDLSENLPVVVEIVDTAENIGKLIPFLDENMKDGLVTMETVRIIQYLK